jgi:hypothetical protein
MPICSCSPVRVDFPQAAGHPPFAIQTVFEEHRVPKDTMGWTPNKQEPQAAAGRRSLCGIRRESVGRLARRGLQLAAHHRSPIERESFYLHPREVHNDGEIVIGCFADHNPPAKRKHEWPLAKSAGYRKWYLENFRKPAAPKPAVQYAAGV